MTRIVSRILILTTLIPLTAMAAVPASQPADPASLKLKPERIVVFKDGYALIVKSATGLADAQGRAFTRDVPEAAILGSFWATSDADKVLAMRAEWDERRELRKSESPCVRIVELLRANKGKRVTLGLADKRTVLGTIVEVLELPPDATIASATPLAPHVVASPLAATLAGFEVERSADRSPFEAMRTSAVAHARMYGLNPAEAVPVESIRRELAPRGGEFVVIDETETGRLVLPISQVQTIAGKEVVTTMTRQEEVFSRTKRLSFDFGKDAAGKNVSLKLFYFTAGLRWIPTYRVTGDLKEQAQIALQGEIINEIEDLDAVGLDLVVGVPNFRFKETVSPLTLESNLRLALRVADPAAMGRNNDVSNFLQAQYSNAMHSAPRADPAAAGDGALSLAGELAGAQGEQDLFLYSMNDFSLKKGARATTPLWQSTVPLRHIYTMDIKAARTRAGETITHYARSRGTPDPVAAASPLSIRLNQVWHQLELTNNSKVPWTTGAALTLRNHLPIGQDLLTYTPTGSCALLPLTVAVDLIGAFDEEELGRKPNALRADGYDYTLIRKKGTLTVTSFRKEKSIMRLSISAGGKVEDASDAGKIKINDFRADDWQDAGHLHVNNHSDVTWDLELAPGQTKTVSYTVQFYVR